MILVSLAALTFAHTAWCAMTPRPVAQDTGRFASSGVLFVATLIAWAAT